MATEEAGSEQPDWPDLGFIVLRCVRQPGVQTMWLHCCAQIRRLYPEAPIVIVDDHSTPALLAPGTLINHTDNDSHNNGILPSWSLQGAGDAMTAEQPGRLPLVVQAEAQWRGCAELLPYYYLHKYRWFKRAVVLHDSMFVQTANLDLGSEPVRFLWHFDSDIQSDPGYERLLLGHLNNSERLVALYNEPSQWHGCFGVASCIDTAFLDRLVGRYSLFALLPHVNTRPARMCLERVFAVVCFAETGAAPAATKSVCGPIMDQPRAMGLKYAQYRRAIAERLAPLTSLPLVKVWVGR